MLHALPPRSCSRGRATEATAGRNTIRTMWKWSSPHRQRPVCLQCRGSYRKVNVCQRKQKQRQSLRTLHDNRQIFLSVYKAKERLGSSQLTTLRYLRFLVFHSDHNDRIPERLHFCALVVQPSSQEVECGSSGQHRVIILEHGFVPANQTGFNRMYRIFSSSSTMWEKSLYSPSNPMITSFFSTYIRCTFLNIDILP